MLDLTPRIPQRPLLWDDIVFDLQDFLLESGFNHAVHIVGGAVRDAYLHHPVKDLDLVTVHGQGIRLARRIADKFGGDVFVLDTPRDIARAFIDTPHGRLTVDVSGYRGDSLADDLALRDFTLNALAVDLLGDTAQLIDPLNGEADLRARLLRRCGESSIPDDPIRALRAVRQSVQLGARIEPQTLADIRQHASRLYLTSPERVRDELYKIFDLPKPQTALRIAEALGVMAVVLPDTATLKTQRVGYTDAWAHALNVIEHLTLMVSAFSPKRTDETAATFSTGMLVMGLDRFRKQIWAHLSQPLANGRSVWGLHMVAALLYPLADSPARAESLAQEALDRLRLSVDEQGRLEAVLTHHHHAAFEGGVDVDPLTAHRFWHTLGARGVDVCLFMLARVQAEEGVAIDQDAWITRVARVRGLLDAFFMQHDTLIAPTPLLDGKALMAALNLSAGRVVGELLTLIREAQVTGEAKTVEDALALARAYLENHSDKSSNR